MPKSDELISYDQASITDTCNLLNQELSLDFGVLYLRGYLTHIINYRTVCEVAIGTSVQLHWMHEKRVAARGSKRSTSERS